MTATITVSTNGKYKVISSTNATLATAIGEVINELDTQNVSNSQTQFSLTHDGTNFSYIATVRLK